MRFCLLEVRWPLDGIPRQRDDIVTPIREFIEKHPVLAYYALEFAISWGGILVLVAPGGIPGQPEDIARLFPFVLVALFAGPSVAGVVMTALVSGLAGFRELRTRLGRWRVGAAWWAAALLTGPVLVAAVLFGLSRYSPDFEPGLLTAEDKLGLLVFGIGWGLVGGGFLEELGWTGFAVPALRRRYSALATGLIVGFWWGTWHVLSAVWATPGLAGEASLTDFVAGFLAFYFVALPAYRVLMVWLYDQTSSLLLAMLMHAVLSASTIVLQPASNHGQFTWNLLLGAAFWVIVAGGLYLRYRRDMNRARARLATVDRHTISTPWGVVEYAERGNGDPVLVVHGIFHNCVGALLSVRDFSGRFIAASRFGYLGSSMPLHPTPADQADALASLLDALGLDRVDVICESAGTTSALQLALRHPDRVKHLAILVGNLPGSPTAVVQPAWARPLNRQLPLWALWTFAPSMMVRLAAAVPKGFAMSSDDARFVAEFIESLFPVSPEGVDFDAFVSNAAVNDFSLESIRVPTLIVHTKDDQLASHDASQRAAKRIPGARFVSLESGGHLMIGQTTILRDELARFFRETPTRRVEVAAS